MLTSEIRAVALFEQGNANKAKQHFRALLKANSQNITAHFYMALLLLSEKKYEDALSHAFAVRDLSPNEPNIYLNIGCIYEGMGDSKKAIRYYRQELRLRSDSGEAWFNIGSLCFDDHQWKKAAQSFEKCVELSHSMEDVVPKLAFCYNKRREIEKEINLYRNLLKRNPKDLWAMENLGAALIDVGEFEESLKSLRRAQKLGSTEPAVDRNLVKVHNALGKSLKL